MAVFSERLFCVNFGTLVRGEGGGVAGRDHTPTRSTIYSNEYHTLH